MQTTSTVFVETPELSKIKNKERKTIIKCSSNQPKHQIAARVEQYNFISEQNLAIPNHSRKLQQSGLP